MRNLFLKFSLTIFVAINVIACGETKPSFHATDITGATIGENLAQNFKLSDADGKPRTFSEFKGKVVVVFFGFTHCPDVCPTTLSDFAAAIKKVAEKNPDAAKKVQVLFVTLDPARDTGEVLKGYVSAFSPDPNYPAFLGLRGDDAATLAAAKAFKVYFAKNMSADGKNYSLDHTAASYVFDAAGNIRLYVKHGQSPDLIAADLKTLLASVKAK